MAWLDRDTRQIIGVETELLVPRPDLGLQRLHTRIEFQKVRLGEPTRWFFLPRQVLVSIESGPWRYRNRHRYTDCRLFSTESKSDRPVSP